MYFYHAIQYLIFMFIWLFMQSVKKHYSYLLRFIFAKFLPRTNRARGPLCYLILSLCFYLLIVSLFITISNEGVIGTYCRLSFSLVFIIFNRGSQIHGIKATRRRIACAVLVIVSTHCKLIEAGVLVWT